MKLRKKFKVLFILLLISSIIIIIYKSDILNILKKDKTTIIKKIEEVIDYEKIEYESCLNEPYLEENYTDTFKEKINETNELLTNYKTYVSYSELDEDYYFGYKDDQVIYGASLIKLVDALYIIDNNIDINETVKYTSNYYNSSNKGLKNHTIGEDITINNLVNYALSWSDNGAHQMLVKYIGFNNLKNYGNSLGAIHTLEGGDNFGFQTAYDTNIYVRRIYELAKTNENAQTFIEYMKNDFYNYLGINELISAHKYGYYNTSFHEIGIIYDTHPYTVSILTQYGKGGFEPKVREINQIIYNLHETYWQEKDTYCYNKSYKK